MVTSFFHTHASKLASGTTRTRIDFALCPTHATVGSYGITTSHDHCFWQGTGRADHTGVTIAVTPVDTTNIGPKKRAVPTQLFDTQQWHELHATQWELHLLRATAHTSIWAWWEEWKIRVEALAKELADTLPLQKSRLL